MRVKREHCASSQWPYVLERLWEGDVHSAVLPQRHCCKFHLCLLSSHRRLFRGGGAFWNHPPTTHLYCAWASRCIIKMNQDLVKPTWRWYLWPPARLILSARRVLMANLRFYRLISPIESLDQSHYVMNLSIDVWGFSKEGQWRTLGSKEGVYTHHLNAK